MMRRLLSAAPARWSNAEVEICLRRAVPSSSPGSQLKQGIVCTKTASSLNQELAVFVLLVEPNSKRIDYIQIFVSYRNVSITWLTTNNTALYYS